MAYFFIGKYDRNEAEQALLENFYEKRKIKVFGFDSYEYVSADGAFEVNLTSASEGRMQIQGEGPDDIFLNKENSMYYNSLRELSRILKAKRIVDDNFDDVFPELIFDDSHD
jgi:hypothetical protein